MIEDARVKEFITAGSSENFGECFLDGEYGNRQIKAVEVEVKATVDKPAYKKTVTCDNLVLCAGQWSIRKGSGAT